jgi:hypothetical protein
MKGATVLMTLSVLLASGGIQGQNARISHWVENAPQNDNSKIALGYPVPLPVDTPLPFDGFRSYEGLHARHQDLAATTPWVHAVAVGTTRAGRTVWAYRLGDEGLITRRGLPEQAMLTNGGIHAREWQTPEIVTGIIELLVAQQGDNYLYSYLRDNANVIVIPVLNVDGFLQTQRYPDSDWMGTDPTDPESAPRDGRMRRKNMLLVDENLLSQADHLNGVDLNRNNPPYWNTSPAHSSADPQSLVHHGAAPQSEPEVQAILAAAQLGPAEALSLYTDLHSFTQVHLWVRNNNDRLAEQTQAVLSTFSNHHASFPAGKFYNFNGANNVARNRGIGTTDEYFTYTYQVPSWTLEVEPTVNGGVDYGGLGRNGHDGFILPESQIRRVRTEMAQSFAIAYYRQSGPPSVSAFRLIDQATAATVFDSRWDTVNATERQQYRFQAQPIQLGRSYTAWIAFDKPMRWRNGDKIAILPGQPAASLDVSTGAVIGGAALSTMATNAHWLDSQATATTGYDRYIHDALAIDWVHPADANNQATVNGLATVTLQLRTSDMTNLRTDADPSTVARWEQGAWSGYENDGGMDLTDTGGTDSTMQYEITSEAVGDPFVVEAGTASAWYDPERNGEGFVLEVLAGNKALMYWFTYDDGGQQDWYIATGEISGNRIVFAQLLQVSGGEFGAGFNPDLITESVVGSASFIWSGCDSGAMEWELDRDGHYRHGRMHLQRITRLMGIDCGHVSLPPERQEARLSGSWFDPSHAGEGYTLELLTDSRALIYWFSFDTGGHRRWFFGLGDIANGKFLFNDMLTTSGGTFGESFDPSAVEELPWGSLSLDIQCDGGTASFMPEEAGFSSGSLNLVRLTALDGLDC